MYGNISYEAEQKFLKTDLKLFTIFRITIWTNWILKDIIQNEIILFEYM